MPRLTYRTADGTAMPAFTGPTWIDDMIERLSEYEDACFDGQDEILTQEIIKTCRMDLKGENENGTD